MSLEKYLRGVEISTYARDILKSHLTNEELLFIEEQLETPPSPSQDKYWSELTNPIVRAFLCLKVNDSKATRLLCLSLLPEVQIEQIFRWWFLAKTIDENPEESVKIFEENNLITSEFIEEFWVSSQMISGYISRNHGPLLTLTLEAFYRNKIISSYEKLRTCLNLKIVSYFTSDEESLHESFREIKKKLVNKVKKEAGLENIPDSWIIEMVSLDMLDELK